MYKRMSMNDGVKAFKESENGILLDVREADEYAEKHVEGSINVPLSVIDTVKDVIADKTALVYVHCRSGVRSVKASDAMVAMGYTNLVEIGGILDYTGETVSSNK